MITISLPNFTPLLKVIKDFITKQLGKIPTNPPGKSDIIKVKNNKKAIENLITIASKIPQHVSAADKAELHLNLFIDKTKSAHRAFGPWNTAKNNYDAANAKYNKIRNDLRKAKNPPRIRRTRKPEKSQRTNNKTRIS